MIEKNSNDILRYILHSLKTFYRRTFPKLFSTLPNLSLLRIVLYPIDLLNRFLRKMLTKDIDNTYGVII